MKEFFKFLQDYSGALSFISAIILSVITLLYLLETRKQRKLSEKMLQSEDAILNIDIKTIENTKDHFDFELVISNIGHKALYRLEYKVLTKRSPRECIAQFRWNGTKEECEVGKNLTMNKVVSGLLPGEKITYYIRVLKKFLDYDNGMYIRIKYINAYKELTDEVIFMTISEKTISYSLLSNLIDNKLRPKIPVQY